MSETIDRGPFISVGALMDNRVESFDGPGISYQGDSFPDIRFGPFPKDGISPARAFCFFNNPYVVLTDGIPSTSNVTAIAASQVAVGLTALNLVTAAPGGGAAGVPSISPGTPIIPQGTTVAVNVLALDFGFTTGTTTNNSTTVNTVDNSQFSLGMWLVVGGAGNSSASKPLIAQVVAISTSNTTGITLSAAAQTGINNAPIGHGNLFSQFLPAQASFGPAQASANAATPYTPAGFAALFNPTESVSRNVLVNGSNATSTAQFLVSGYDIYGAPMTELITGVNGSAAGKKAFKYISSIVPQSATANSYSIGVGNIAGIHLRSDKWEYLNVFYNGAFMTSVSGWTAAVTTNPATNTTGDVRGVINASTLGAFNGSARLAIMMSVPIYNMINATPINSVPLFGVAQSTT